MSYDIRDILREIAQLLGQNGYSYAHDFISDVANRTEKELADIINSNEVWGGSGSIADQSFCDSSDSVQDRIKYYKLMLELGDYIKSNNENYNKRINGWMELFRITRKRMELL